MLGVMSSPDPSVAAGRAAHQPAALVDQVDGQAVDLQLAQVGRAALADLAVDARGPAGQLLVAERVVEAEQPLEMLDRA
jgi:hypothetical protein